MHRFFRRDLLGVVCPPAASFMPRDFVERIDFCAYEEKYGEHIAAEKKDGIHPEQRKYGTRKYGEKYRFRHQKESTCRARDADTQGKA